MLDRQSLELAACFGKTKHETKACALIEIERSHKVKRSKACKLVAYKCKFCDCWHIGNNKIK